MKQFAQFLLAFVFSTSSMAQLPAYDVSGRKGNDGSDGRSYNPSQQYSSSSGRGSRGQDGGNAGSSTPGQAAGSISVSIRDKDLESGKPQVAIVEIDANLVDANGNRSQKQSTISAGTAGFIYLQAKGGKGGRGGYGGNGEGGQRGCDGRDATESSSGTNGCSGGDGGDGGLGTKGSAGGQGGNIQVELKSADTHLSLMIDADVDGGEGGAEGKNGTPGEGGSGGRGGSSKSWTTRHHDGQSCTERNNGNGSSTRVCTDKYRYESHYKAGGSSGSSGSRGYSKNGDISAGKKGNDGKFTFVVDEGGIKKTYTRPFSIRVREYEIVDENADQIIEPGETITIQNIKVQNASEMPWNGSKADFLVFLENSGWILAEPTILKVPSLGPGQTTTLSGQLQFKVKKTDSFGREKRWSTQDSIVPKNLVTRVNRTQEGFSLVRPITITFPLEITPLVSKTTVGPGEVQKILWKVKNISSKALGESSASTRTIVQNLKIKGTDEQDVLYREKGQGFSLLSGDRLLQIAKLGPGEEILIEGEVQFSENALPYTSRDIEVDLGLGQLNDPSKPQKIQQQSFTFRISQLYNYNKNSDWILIVNGNTTREEFLAWNQLAKSLGVKMDVWDISYYGKLMLSQTMTQHANSFTENYSRKTAIILNNGTQSRRDELPTFPLDQLTQKDFVESLLKGGLNVYVLGPEKDKFAVFEKLVVDKASRPLEKSTKELIEKVKAESAQMQFGSIAGTQETIYKLYGRPSEIELREKTSELAKKLLEVAPDQRFIVSYDVNIAKEGWFKYSYGLNVQKVLSPVFGKLVVLDVNEQSMHDPNFVLSRENIYSVLEAMNYGYKLKTIANMPDPNAEIAGEVADAVIRDLINEQNDMIKVATSSFDEITKRSFKSLMSEETFYAGLDRKVRCLMGLDKCKSDKKLDVNTKIGSEVLRIIAAMRFYNSLIQPWSGIITGESKVQTVIASRRQIDRLQEAVINNQFPTQKEKAIELIRTHELAIQNDYAERRSRLVGSGALETAGGMLIKKSHGATYTTDRMLKSQNAIRRDGAR